MACLYFAGRGHADDIRATPPQGADFRGRFITWARHLRVNAGRQILATLTRADLQLRDQAR